jgi:quinolinate synthase
MYQPPLPAEYDSLNEQEIDRRILAAKKRLGKTVVILGHHYQRDETIKYADYRGDSYRLSKEGAALTEAKHIIFCGVHFMAESARILAAPHQTVILPNLSAGCSMADMATLLQVEECWKALDRLGIARGVIPVTYINSAANLKGFTGRHGGAVCTSSNCEKILKWALGTGEKIMFFPDQHLGRNTAVDMGFPLSDMVVWTPGAPGGLGGLTEEQLHSAKFILWHGYCSVHARFNVKQIAYARERYPDIKVIVHPECTRDVVEAADMFGSTEKIVNTIRQSPKGSKWAVGTEINLVNRIAVEEKENDKLIFCLDPIVCPCSTMYRVAPIYLLWALESIEKGNPINQIEVPAEVARYAKITLDRMLQIAG